MHWFAECRSVTTRGSLKRQNSSGLNLTFEGRVDHGNPALLKTPPDPFLPDRERVA